MKNNITLIGEEVKMLALLKNYLFEAVGLMLVLLVMAVCLCHLCTYFREQETQSILESPRLKPPVITRRISRSKTYKVERKVAVLEEEDQAPSVTQ